MNLFYLGQQGSDRSRENCRFFLEKYKKLSSGNLLIILDSRIDCDLMLQHVQEGMIIIDLESEVRKISLTIDDQIYYGKIFTRNNLGRFYSILRKTNIYGVPFEDAVLKLLSFFHRTLTEYSLKFIHFGINQAFRSLGGAVLHEFARNSKIPFFMVYNTPLKGRHYVYNNIYHQPYEIGDMYQKLLTSGLALSNKEKVERYFEAYKKFKKTTHKPLLKEKGRNSKNKRNFQNLLNTAKNNILKHVLVKRYKKIVRSSISSKPYALLLLNKPNNWLTNYALSYFDDIAYIISTISQSLPYGYDLLIKDHPLSAFPNTTRTQVYETIKNLPNVFMLSRKVDTDEAVKKAETIIYNCSTSGVESLMEMKHVITFGKKPVFFGFKNPPVHIVSVMEELSEIITKCLASPPPEDKIYAYFYALLSYSENYHGQDDECSIIFKQDKQYFENMAAYLYSTLKKRKVI